MVYELVGYSTEGRGDNAVRYRRYTKSLALAEAWERIPRIQFTDSGHGIEFGYREVKGRRGKERPSHSEPLGHVELHLARNLALAKGKPWVPSRRQLAAALSPILCSHDAADPDIAALEIAALILGPEEAA